MYTVDFSSVVKKMVKMLTKANRNLMAAKHQDHPEIKKIYLRKCTRQKSNSSYNKCFNKANIPLDEATKKEFEEYNSKVEQIKKDVKDKYNSKGGK